MNNRKLIKIRGKKIYIKLVKILNWIIIIIRFIEIEEYKKKLIELQEVHNKELGLLENDLENR